MDVVKAVGGDFQALEFVAGFAEADVGGAEAVIGGASAGIAGIIS